MENYARVEVTQIKIQEKQKPMETHPEMEVRVGQETYVLGKITVQTLQYIPKGQNLLAKT